LDEIYELEQFRQEQLTLRKLGSYLKSSLTTLEAYSAIECFGPQLWPAATGAVYCFPVTGDTLERVAAWGDASRNRESLALQDCWALRRSQPHIIRDTGSDLLCRHIANLGLIELPIPVHGAKLVSPFSDQLKKWLKV
jgi:hypothetical protein